MNNDDENKTQIMLVMIIHIYTVPIQKDKVINKDKVKLKVMREEFIGFFIIKQTEKTWLCSVLL